MNAINPAPYTRDSIQKAKQYQQWERLQAARDMGIPSVLVDLYEVYGFDQTDTWVRMIQALRRD
jgi:hypothetical protein